MALLRKTSACNEGDPNFIPELGRASEEGNSYPLPVFLPRELYGQRSLSGYSPRGFKESDAAE